MKKLYSANEFNEKATIRATNCLAFAFGELGNEPEWLLPSFTLRRELDKDTGRPLNPADNPCKAFIKKAEFFGIKLKEVSSLEETEGKTAFLLWGWYFCPKLFGGYCCSDFHVARKNPDGTFEHKPDFYEPACVTTLKEIRKEYPEKFYTFVVCD